MKRRKSAMALAALLAGGPCWSSVTQSLSTTFVEVLVEGIPVASRYVIEGKAVDITNKSDGTMKIRVDALEPMAAEMRAGYEPIPDAAWVGFEPRSVEVPPGQTATVKAVIYVPDDPALIGRRFQVMLHLHADPSGGTIMSIGLKPRLMFSVTGSGGAAKPSVINAPVPKAWLTPYNVKTERAELTVACGTLEAMNMFNEEMTYEVTVDPGAIAKIDRNADETPLPDPAWVAVVPPVLILRPYTKAEMAVTARLPIASEHFGKAYVAALRTVARRKGEKPVEVFNRVRIVVPALALSGTVTAGVK